MPMPTIREAICLLETYTDDPIVGSYATSTISSLKVLSTLDEGAINHLTFQLKVWIDKESLDLEKITNKEGRTFDNALYNTLLALAAEKPTPINDKDYISQKEKIPSDHLVVVIPTSPLPRFAPAIPLAIQALADLTGICVKYLMECKAAESKSDTRYAKIHNCRHYLANEKKRMVFLKRNGTILNQLSYASFSLIEVIFELSLEQSSKLKDCYEDVLSGKLSKYDAGNLSLTDFTNGYKGYSLKKSIKLSHSYESENAESKNIYDFEIALLARAYSLKPKRLPQDKQAYILTIDQLKEKLATKSEMPSDTLCEIAAFSNFETVNYIFKNEKLRSCLLSSDFSGAAFRLVRIAIRNPAKAILILNDKELRELILTEDPKKSRELYVVCKRLHSIALGGIKQTRYIFNDPDLRRRLLAATPETVSCWLSSLIYHNIDQGFFILNDRELRTRWLTGIKTSTAQEEAERAIIFVAKNSDPSQIVGILKDPILELLDGDALANIASTSSDHTAWILANETLLTKILTGNSDFINGDTVSSRLSLIAESGIGQAMWLLDVPETRFALLVDRHHKTNVSKRLVAIAKLDVLLATQILTEPDLKNELIDCDSVDLKCLLDDLAKKFPASEIVQSFITQHRTLPPSALPCDEQHDDLAKAKESNTEAQQRYGEVIVEIKSEAEVKPHKESWHQRCVIM